MRLNILDKKEIRESAIKRINKKVVKKEGCWSWKGYKSENGYPLLRLGGRKGYQERVSRIVLYLRNPIQDKNLCALHTCDNPECSNPDHLYWGTKKQNTQDMIDRGRHEKPPVLYRDDTVRCNIKTKDIENIEKLCKIIPVSKIASYYKVSEKTIWRIIKDNNFDNKKFYSGKTTPKSKIENIDLSQFILDSLRYNITDLSKKYKVNRKTIYRWKEKYQICT